MSLRPDAPDAPVPPASVEAVADAHGRLQEAQSTVVVGQEDVIRQLFLSLLCSGHSLLEGVPGTAKTLLVRTLAASLGVRFGRVQFTPDLLPSDILGTGILHPERRDLEFRPGPVFTDLLLADEINRAPAKTQAALLEAMQERAVTVYGERHALGPYFSVFATQNPVEHEGTYPLPEAELDRFLFKIVVDYPSEDAERALLERHHPGEVALPTPVLGADEISSLRAAVDAVIVREEIVAYVVSLSRASRRDVSFALGASPRATLALLRAAKAEAALAGRDYVLPEDVQSMLPPCWRHRVLLDPAAEVEGTTPDQALEGVLRGVAVPR